ncbi:L-ascorbate peroxidase [Apostasia shenzhenica]|uniref:L-ascorbate peroxidase n=1 Tax=Apostasia shenzhenica TaxID=1088818 RepID=A0A2I0B151_9ASPA|nr:L-ascorbate peroxidase [Apostasia shenzhenica]
MSAFHLRPLSSDPAGELDVLRHYCNSLGMDRAEVGILEQSYEIGLGSLLESGDGGALETKIGLEILSDLTHEPLERKLADQKLGALLILTDLPQRNSPRPKPMGLLDAAGSRSRLASSLRRQLLPRSLPSGRFSRCLLRSRHLRN